MVSIKQLLQEGKIVQGEVTLKGWVRTFRSNRFIALNDGSTIDNLQVVVDFENTDPELLKRITTGAAIEVKGQVVESQGKGQSVELQATALTILGDSNPEEYPIQPKKHSLEFLRENAHLRVRSNTFSAVMRVRSTLAFAIHKYFQDNGFFYVNTPIITGSDAEGAGEMFRVTTLDAKNPPLTEDGEVDYKKDFFGRETNLTVSGQLEGETFAMALGKIYTFGPTFRAENSNTSRHLAEFWMIEPEVAFIEIEENMQLAQDFVQFCVNWALEHCREDIEFLAKMYDNELIDRLRFVVENDFVRLTYTEGIEILKKAVAEGKKFEYPVDWGTDLQSEHERYLVEDHFKKPVILTDYPKDIKSFYMKQNDDGKTVRAMDVLFPRIGEIIGGSQREEDYEKLRRRAEEMGVPTKDIWWYLDTRRFGTAPHSGFGLGFERLMLFVTGMQNIRDVIPFPRTPHNANF